MRNSKIVLGLVTVSVVAALLLVGCGKTPAPTTAPPTTAPPTTAPATTVAPITAPPTTAPATTVAPTTVAPTTTRPAAATAAPTTSLSDMVTVTLKKLDGTTMQKMLRKPQYGGTITYVATDPLWFDDYFGVAAGGRMATAIQTNEVLTMYDWTLGPGGTGERTYGFGWSSPPTEHMRPTSGGLAETFEIVDPNTIVYQIRKGVRFALNPKSEAATLVNGREMTADDVAFSIRREWTSPKAYITASNGYGDHLVIDETKALDKYTVQVKWKPGKMPISYFSLSMTIIVWPREAIEKYTYLTDWKNSVGTGPFILTDYVKANSATLVRNPNYWMKDPLFPENQLPYVDSMTYLFVTDRSTQQAALRTAKIDTLNGLVVEEYLSLMKTTPQLKASETGSSAPTVFMRLDNPDLPWNDIRVRQALSMSIDRKAIKDSFYSGYAQLIDYPVRDAPEFRDIYVPISSQPANIRELYEYNPDKAKQLLAAAGYPSGFAAEVLANPTHVDWLQIVQFYWSKIGVDLKIDLKETAVFTSTQYARKYTQMIAGGMGGTLPFMMGEVRKGLFGNLSMVNDPKVEEASLQIDTLWPDQTKQAQILKALVPHVLEQRWWTVLVAPANFAVWWPWLANYNGEIATVVGRTDVGPKHLWVDQEVKKTMGK